MYLYEWILVCNCTLQNTFYFVSWALGRVQHRPCIIFNIWKVEWILHLACLRSINPAATTSESQIIFILSRASSSLSWACKTFILFVVCPIALRRWVPLLDFIHFNRCQKLLTIKTILVIWFTCESLIFEKNCIVCKYMYAWFMNHGAQWNYKLFYTFLH